jgi:RNA polymerase sigma factor (sigma-70 family)
MGLYMMNLIDLKRKKRELSSFLNYMYAEVNEKRDPVKATRFDKTTVDGTKKHYDTSDVVLAITDMEKDIEKTQQEYDRITSLINELEKGYKELNERDKLIYLEYWCKGYSTSKIGVRYGLSDRQVRRILKKVEKKL